MSGLLCDDECFAQLTSQLEGVIFYGDPHGAWQPLFHAIDDTTHTVFILGDLAEAKQRPEHVEAARDALCQLRARGIGVHFILGNHDTETEAIHALIFEEFQENLIEEEVLSIGQPQCRIAGLGVNRHARLALNQFRCSLGVPSYQDAATSRALSRSMFARPYI